MPSSYLPAAEAQLVTWTNDFRANILAQYASYGLTEQQATQYQATRTTFVNAYNTAQNPITRTRPNIEAKNVAKTALIKLTRQYVDMIQAWPGMTNEKREQLGITVRGRKPTPSPVPGKPFVKVEKVDGREVTISLQRTATSKGKPKGATGANVFVHYGDEPPMTAAGWVFDSGTGKTKTTLQLDQVSDACTVWVTAFWYNGRKQSGLAADPVSVNLAAMNVLPGAMKIKQAA